MSTVVTGSLVRVTFVRRDVNNPALGPLPPGAAHLRGVLRAGRLDAGDLR